MLSGVPVSWDCCHDPAGTCVLILVPQHVWEKYPWDDPEKNPEVTHPSVVSGPYKLVEKKPRLTRCWARPGGMLDLSRGLLGLQSRRGLFYNKAWSGQNNRIKGIEPTVLGIGWNSEDWYIQEDSGS